MIVFPPLATTVLRVTALAGVLTPMVYAQDYPNRPVRFIVPFPPGGGNDFIGRFFAEAQKLAIDGVAPAGGTPAEFSALIKSEIAQWRTVAMRAGVKPD